MYLINSNYYEFVKTNSLRDTRIIVTLHSRCCFGLCCSYRGNCNLLFLQTCKSRCNHVDLLREVNCNIIYERTTEYAIRSLDAQI